MDKPALFQQPTTGVGLAVLRGFLALPDEARGSLLATLDAEMRARVEAWASGNERGQK